MRGVDDSPGFRIPEGLGLGDVPVEKTPDQATMMFGSVPSLARDLAGTIKERVNLDKGKQKRWKGGDSHPDFQFTKKWLEETSVDDRKRSLLIKRAMLRMNRYRLREKAETSNRETSLADKTAFAQPLKRKRHFPTKEVVFLIALLGLAIAFWFLLG